jgi:hypothetical protein
MRGAMAICRHTPRPGIQRMKSITRAALWLGLAAPLASLAQGHAHVHGVATLDIAVEPRRILLFFDSRWTTWWASSAHREPTPSAAAPTRRWRA